MDAKTDAVQLNGGKIIAAIKGAGVEFVLSVPDIHTSHGLLRPIAGDPELRLIRVCKEDECIGIASGLSYSDKRALILIQYTGFLDSLNAIRAVAVEYKQPLCIMVGRHGHEADRLPAEAGRYGLRIVQPLCVALRSDHRLVRRAPHVAHIAPALEETA